MFENYLLRLNKTGFSCAFKALQWSKPSFHLCRCNQLVVSNPLPDVHGQPPTVFE